ncbi:MAG: PQQ-dependent sugar dehydrogenase [Candidatus Humimicrobiaceae bacterium]
MQKAKIKIIIAIVIFLAIIAGSIYLFQDRLIPLFFGFQKTSEESGITSQEAEIEIFAENLEIPWEIIFLPEGDVLVSERPGRIIKLGEEKKVYELDKASHQGEGGLLGMAIHPDYEGNNWLYVYFTANSEDNTNRVERYVFSSKGLSGRTLILDNIPAGNIHNGGRIRFGPDGYLYITTGDAGNSDLAQNLDSLAGKILRVTDKGKIPGDNPFDSPVYSYGHRNPQGLAWDDEGRLWASEHGANARDELNLIKPGNNYGWPVIQGMEEEEGMETPMAFSGADYTWAPSGADYFNNSIFFTGLRGAALYEAMIPEDLDDDILVIAHFKGNFGRLRNVKLGPEGSFYILTNNRDGRGSPSDNDDRILRLAPEIFE